MTGKRLLDAAAIFKASRGVAAKHVALRQHEFDSSSRTSSLAKAVKSQTERVSVTVKAASNLAERFNGPGPDHSTQASQSRRPFRAASVLSQDGASGAVEDLKKQSGLSQDYFNERSDTNVSAVIPPDGNLVVVQEKAKEYPSPDGSIPPAETSEVPMREKESHSEKPPKKTMKALWADGREETDRSLQPTSNGRTSIPKSEEGTDPAIAEKAENLQQEAEKQIPSQADDKIPKNKNDAQQSDGDVPDAQLNQDVFSSSSSKPKEERVPQAQAVPEQDKLSDEAYAELFHSPRVARILGAQPKPSKLSKGLEMFGAQETIFKQTQNPHEKDQVSSSVWASGKESEDGTRNRPNGITGSNPSQAKGSEDVDNLAVDMAKDTEAMAADPSQVCLVRDISTALVLIY